MKVLHLSSESSWRGGEQQIAYLIEELTKAGVQNIVACRKHSAFESYCQKKEIPHISLNFTSSLNIATALRIKRYCQEQQPDLMHLHSSKSHSLAVLSGWLGNSTPMILSRRVDFHLKTNWLSQKKYNYPGIRRIICVSDAIKEIVQSDIKQPEKAVTVHSGIDLKKFSAKASEGQLRKQYNIPANYWLVGNTAAIAPHKDYFTFVDTVALLEQQNFPAYYFIIGTGPMEQEIKNYVATKGLEKKIIFTGFLHNIPSILPELDLFLMTSKTEGLGTSLLDAFASGVAVVATAAGGVPEIVLHEQTGLLAPVGKPKEIAYEVQRLYKDVKLQEQLKKGAYELVQQFSKEETARKTLDIYREVLSE
ncbi:glycosyltransferase family 4 protein [Nafulsella turpanensis]|uniref:glycosyltransferase family 4 protein n=1 Tax=Nafulsella turpanensis TaxID=1265690 RepID=UPI000348A3CB|nr:glycosyltransferase family 4 protein [Nafulsella turpanensis]